jgi:hypothetical protein
MLLSFVWTCQVESIAGERFWADVMHETLRRSSLTEAGEGTWVNLELPLRPTDRLGGHIVEDHVYRMGTVRVRRDDSFSRVVEIAAPPELLRHVVKEGSIAVDDAERTYSTSLAQWSRRARRDRRRKTKQRIRPSIQHLLDAITGAAAFVRTAAWTSFRHPARLRPLLRDVRHPVRPANSALFVFLNPRSQDLYVVWDLAIETLAPTRGRP